MAVLLRELQLPSNNCTRNPASLFNFAFLSSFGKVVSSDNKTDNSQIDT